MGARRERSIHLRAAWHGGERWVIAALRGRGALAERVELLLRDEPGVRFVKANPVTGTLLIEFAGESPMRSDAVFLRISDAARREVPIAVRSESPGRRRYAVPSITGRPALARLVERSLRAELGVIDAHVSAVTGTVAVQFEPDARITGEVVQRRIREAEDRLDAGDSGGNGGVSPSLAYAGAAAIIAVPRLFLGAAIAANPLVLGVSFVAGAVLTTYGAYRFLRTHIVDESGSGSCLRRAARDLRPFRGQFAFATASSVVRKVLDFAPPVIIGFAINIAAGRPLPLFAALGLGSLVTQLAALALVAWIIYGLELWFEYLTRSRWRLLADGVQHQLRVAAYGHAQLVELRYVERRHPVAVIDNDIRRFRIFIADGVHSLVEAATNLAVIVVAFAFLAPEVAWIGLLPVPVIASIAVRRHQRLAPLRDQVEHRAGELRKLLAKNLDGIETIRGFGAEEDELQRVESASARYLQTRERAIRRTAAFAPAERLPVQTAFAALVIIGGRAVLARRISGGAFASLLFLLPRFLAPFTHFSRTIDGYQQAMDAMQRVFDLLDEPVAGAGGGVRLPRHEVRGAVAFKEVSFAYGPDDAPVLSDFNLTIDAGETVGIVGERGSGTTTMVKLLLRFYDAQAGRVLLDGRDVRELDPRDVRDAVHVVSDDVFLTDGTVRDNIAYGAEDASDADVEQAARLANAMDVIDALPSGFDTELGAGGMSLTDAQRQRLSLARALLRNPAVLILDQATACFDLESEAVIQDALAALARDRTMIVIARRLSLVRHTPRIVVLARGGRVLESGSHDELLKKNGVYAAMWHVQTGGEAPE